MTSEQAARRDSGEDGVLWEVVSENTSLIRSCASKYMHGSNAQHAHDLIQVAYLACYTAASKFKPNDDPRYWSRYAARWITGDCSRYVQKNANSVYYQDALSTADYDDEDEFIDPPEDLNEHGIGRGKSRVDRAVLLREVVNWCKDNLNDKQFGMFCDTFLKEDRLTPAQLSEKYSISVGWARKSMARIRNRLMGRFGDYEI